MNRNYFQRGAFGRFLASSARTQSQQSLKSRKLWVEGLEDRQLLSATPYETASDLCQELDEDLHICGSPVADQGLEAENIASLSDTINNLLREAGQDPNNISQDFVFNLSSNPSSTFTIFLDFDGNQYTGNMWTNGAGVVSPKFDMDGNVDSFSNSELRDIYDVWLRVSEDYAPFNVNVTTKDPGADALKKSSNGDKAYGIRVAIGGSCYDWYNSSCGGVAYVGSFDWNDDVPCFVFPKQLYSAKNVAEAAAHEVGHTLGLSHDGTSTQGYYGGADGWAPIMGVGYSQPLTQWSKGEYYDANNRQDDLEIITSKGFDYKPDDRGDTIAKATALQFVSSGVLGQGLIERNTDVDFYSFELDGQQSVITVGGYSEITNLDALVKLYDASGNLLKVYDPTNTLYVTIDVSNFSPGKYYMSVEGTGLTVDGNLVYSDYASLGVYYITTALSTEVADPYEPNNTQVGAFRLGVINEPTTITAQIDPRSDADYFNFSIGSAYTGVKITIDYAYAQSSSALRLDFNRGTGWETATVNGSKTYYALTSDDSLYFRVQQTAWRSAIPYSVTITPLESPELTSLTFSTNKAKVGLPITAIPPYEGLTANYQWYRGSSEETMVAVPGATSATYVPTSDDLGLRLMAVATGYGNCYGTASAITDKVVAQTVWTVGSTSDAASSSPLTLRQALASADSGDRIVFAPSLNGQTINVGSLLRIEKSITIDASDLADGITLDGGGSAELLFVPDSDAYLSVKGLTFANAKTDTYGAAIAFNGAILDVDDCAFVGNEATSANSVGAAIAVITGKATINGSAFRDNATQGGGAAIYADSGTETSVSYSSFDGNVANKLGGALMIGGELSVENSSFTNNEANNGGAIYSGDKTVLVNALFANNKAKTYGGAVYAETNLEAYNCTVADNSASTFGGGFYIESGQGYVYNSILLFNEAQRASGANIEKSADAALYGYNNLTNYSKWTDGADNLTYSQTKPLFVDRENGDYALPSNSQAVDVGNNAYVFATREITGNTRVYNSVVDLGAYEYMLAPKPNLLFSVPLGWSDSVVLSASDDAVSSAESFKFDQDLYLRFSYANDSNVAISNSFVVRVYLDGSAIKTYSVQSLGADASKVETLALGKLAAGAHALRIALDAGDSVEESNENDNVWEFSFKAIDDDEYEPNDYFDAPTDLGIALERIEISAKAGAEQNEDWYRFSTTALGTADSYVNLAFPRAEGSAELAMEIYDAAGNWIASSELKADDDSEEISLNALPVGTYYVRIVNSVESQSSIPYNLTVQPPAPPKADLDRATPEGWASPIVVAADSGATVPAEAYRENIAYYANFCITNNSPTPATETFYVEVKLDDETLATYTVNSLTAYGVKKYSVALGQLTVGAHMVKVVVDSTDAIEEESERNNTFTQTIVVTSVDDEYEPNDTMAAAYNLGALIEEQTLQLWAGSNQNEDWFRFSLPEEGTSVGRVALTYEHVSGQADVDLYLYDADGNQVAYSNRTTGFESISLKGLPAGVYYVKAFNAIDVARSVPYELTLKPSTVAKPNLKPVALSSWTDSILLASSPSSSTDAETFFDGTNYYVRFAFRNDSSIAITTPFTVNCYLDDALAKTYEVESLAIGANKSFSFGSGVLAIGTPSIRVELDANNVIDESNEFDNVYAKTFVVTSGEDQFEPNNTFDEATDLGTLAGLSTYSLNAQGGQDEDWFKFTTISPGSEEDFVRLTYAHSPSAADVDLYLYDAQCNLLASSRDDSGVEYVSLADLPAGTYYVQTLNYYDKTLTVPYSLEISAPVYRADIPTLDVVATSPFDVVATVGAVDDATGYFLQYSTELGFANATEFELSVAGEVPISGLTEGTTYYFRVKASSASLPDSPWSQVVEVATDEMTQLDAPALTVAANGSSRIVATIGAPEGAEAYVLEYSTDESFESATSIAAVAGANEIAGLTFETTYYVRVKATATYRYDSDWTVGSATTTAGLDPTGISVVSTTYQSADVEFSAVDGAGWYQIQYSSNPNFMPVKSKSVSSAGVKTLTDLEPETTYYVRVKAIMPGLAPSEWSEASFTTDQRPDKLETPTLAVVNVASDAMQIEIGAVENAGWYRVQYSLNEDFVPVKSVSFAKPGVKTIGDLLPNETYYVRVCAIRPDYLNSNYATATATTSESDARLETPTLEVRTLGPDSLYVLVGSVDGAENYELEYASNDKFTNAKTLSVEPGATTIDGLLSSTTYYFRVRATSTEKIQSKDSETVSATTAKLAKLDAPTASVVASEDSFAITIGAVDKGAIYRVQYSLSENFVPTKTKTYSKPGTKTIDGLTPGATYYVRVKATAPSYEDSEWSNLVVKVGESAENALSAPSLSALALDAHAVKVTVGSVEGAASYRLQYATEEDFSDASETDVESGKTTIGNLLAGKTYRFRVKAIADDGSESDWSTVLSATTLEEVFAIDAVFAAFDSLQSEF
ncbi:MAG: pre-peptidase C-terminal domain-containing protein [Thermoguttaceae bacterium]|nr:pre-peptidase C-terminal domain-containing protein [Thermoguttaceae bacterium]